MEIFEHKKVCDSCGRVIQFPRNGWLVSDPPDKGWISVSLSDGSKKDFCPLSGCLQNMTMFVASIINAAP